jgi:hypothetical protein
MGDYDYCYGRRNNRWDYCHDYGYDWSCDYYPRYDCHQEYRSYGR